MFMSRYTSLDTETLPEDVRVLYQSSCKTLSRFTSFNRPSLQAFAASEIMRVTLFVLEHHHTTDTHKQDFIQCLSAYNVSHYNHVPYCLDKTNTWEHKDDTMVFHHCSGITIMSCRIHQGHHRVYCGPSLMGLHKTHEDAHNTALHLVSLCDNHMRDG